MPLLSSHDWNLITTPQSAMKHMLSGKSKQTQASRIKPIQKSIESLPYYHQVDLNNDILVTDKNYKWQKVFNNINTNKPYLAIKEFCDLIKSKDDLAVALIKTHNIAYIKQIITLSAEIPDKNKYTDYFPGNIENAFSGDKSDLQLNTKYEARFNKQTFESIIKSLIYIKNTEKNKSILIAPPSHHARYDRPAGFCLLNTQLILAAVLIKNEQNNGCNLKIIQCGLDVNQDDGNKDILIKWTKENFIKNYFRIDVYDSRVWPGPDNLNQEPENIIHAYEIDLYTQELKPEKIIDLCIEEIKLKLHNIDSKKEKAFISLPIGFDSSINEKAYCGTYSNQQPIPKDSLKRFTYDDYIKFFRGINNILNNPQNKHKIAGALITLEGGYDLKLTPNDDLNLEPYIGLMLKYLNKKSIISKKRKTPILDFTIKDESINTNKDLDIKYISAKKFRASSGWEC